MAHCLNHANKKVAKAGWEHIRQTEKRMSDLVGATRLNFGDSVPTLLAAVGPADHVQVMNALLHMHFNRYGISGELEAHAMSILWKMCARYCARAA